MALINFIFQYRLWILGGQGVSGTTPLSSTEYIYPDGSVEPGPLLPTPLYKMCSVVTSDDKVLVIGGQTSSDDGTPSEKTWEFDPTRGKWQPGPSLDTGRSSLGCANIYSPYHQRQIVFAFGGVARDPGCQPWDKFWRSCDKVLASVEMLDYQNEESAASWEKGKRWVRAQLDFWRTQ